MSEQVFDPNEITKTLYSSSLDGINLEITESAYKELSKVVEEDSKEFCESNFGGGEMFIKIGVTGGGCSGFSYYMTFAHDSELRDGVDIQFKLGELNFCTDEISQMYMGGTVIDYVKGDIAGGTFTFNNPVAVDTCSCGSSFSV